MDDSARRTNTSRRLVPGVVGSLGWLGFGGAFGWFFWWLLERWNDQPRHHLIEAGVAVCAFGILLWLLATRGLVRLVRTGLREQRGEIEPRPHSGLQWLLLPFAAPIIGMILAISTTGSGHVGSSTIRTVASAPPPAHALRSGTEQRGQRVALTYVVRAGDRIQSIAEHFYGDRNDWVAIAKANMGRREPGGQRFIDPTLLRPGWSLTIPVLADGSVPTPPRSHPPTAPPLLVRDEELFAALAGFGLIGTALFARRQVRRRRLQAMRSIAGTAREPLGDADACAEVAVRPLAETELTEWIDAANRLLFAELSADRSLPAPRVSLVRAGPNGLELLLDVAEQHAPPSFLVSDEGHTWTLDPALELDDIRARVAASIWAFLPTLVPVGEDENGSYLVAVGVGEALGVNGAPDEVRRALGALTVNLTNAPWAEVELYRLGPADFARADDLTDVGESKLAYFGPSDTADPLWRLDVCEHQPVVISSERSLAEAAREESLGLTSLIAPLPDADRTLYYENGRVTIEPMGVTLPALLPTETELSTTVRLEDSAKAAPTLVLGDPAATPPPVRELPKAGVVEARILRAVPDLIGDVSDAIEGPAVQFVAYLAAHGGSATTARLRDALGSYNQDDSRASKTVWHAAGFARKALGRELVPSASNNQQYTLSPKITCDWVRFNEMATIARSAERAGDGEAAITALTRALELVEGIPGADSNRFLWLEREQLFYEIQRVVTEAAHELVELALREKSLALADWAITQGQRVSPYDGELQRDAMRLASARGDEVQLQGVYERAAAAVDELDVGADLDEATDALMARLRRGSSSHPGGPSTVA